MDIKIGNTEKNYIFKPNSTEKEVAQNIENIISRIKFNVPLARNKGIIAENTDKPQEIAKAELIADILEEIDREETRFEATQISISDDYIQKGQMSADIKGAIKDE